MLNIAHTVKCDKPWSETCSKSKAAFLTVFIMLVNMEGDVCAAICYQCKHMHMCVFGLRVLVCVNYKKKTAATELKSAQ